MARAFHHTQDVRRGQDQAGNFLDVRFIDTVKQPFEVVKAIYGFAGLPLTDEAETSMQRWMEQNRRDSRGAHEYKAEDFGLSEAQLKRDFADYRAAYIDSAA